MVEYGITTLQTKPSLFKEMSISKIVDKRQQQDLGYFISAKYEKMISSIIQKIEKEEKRAKLSKLKAHQDIEFLEVGIDDGLK